MDVRRLAGIDKYDGRGTTRRRWIILAEFLVGVVMVTWGTWLLASSHGLGSRALGLWLTGAGLNYAPLSAYAIALIRSGVLDPCRTSSEPRPRCSASRHTINGHRAEVDLRSGLGVQEVGRRAPARTLPPALRQLMKAAQRVSHPTPGASVSGGPPFT